MIIPCIFSFIGGAIFRRRSYGDSKDCRRGGRPRMREILFRGKRVDNGEWVYSQTVFSHLDNFYIPAQNLKCTVMRNLDTVGNISEIRCKDGKCFFKVQPETIGQFTGLTDKNGKKIFEGDCFKTYCTGLPVYKHIVGYYPEHFAFMARCIETNTVHYLSDYRPSAIEIIGNIHDNPELLEVGE